MIRPEEIRQKAKLKYAAVVQAWLRGDDSLFPLQIPFNHKLPRHDHAAAIKAVQALRSESREERGYGYRIEWRECNSRIFGRNPFPHRLVFETRDDLLRFIGKQSEFAAISQAADRLRHVFPELEDWIRRHWKKLPKVAGELDGLIAVVRYLQEHPRPGCFLRELPIPVETKFIERHAALLQAWLDLVLPPHAIRADEDRFERRYGFRYPNDHVLVRLLDQTLEKELGFPCPEFSLPLHSLEQLPVRDATVFIVENKVNLLTFPFSRRGIALGGIGHGVGVLRNISWLGAIRIVYWGDVDVEGLQILSLFRSTFPQVESLLMDLETLERFRPLLGTGSGQSPPAPVHLTESEAAAFEVCREENVRLEQERLPQDEVEAAVARRLAAAGIGR